ncbi:hypothetical protein RI367_006837 [Sorochytrium milnesiophthora]
MHRSPATPVSQRSRRVYRNDHRTSHRSQPYARSAAPQQRRQSESGGLFAEARAWLSSQVRGLVSKLRWIGQPSTNDDDDYLNDHHMQSVLDQQSSLHRRPLQRVQPRSDRHASSHNDGTTTVMPLPRGAASSDSLSTFAASHPAPSARRDLFVDRDGARHRFAESAWSAQHASSEQTSSRAPLRKTVQHSHPDLASVTNHNNASGNSGGAPKQITLRKRRFPRNLYTSQSTRSVSTRASTSAPRSTSTGASRLDRDQEDEERQVTADGKTKALAAQTAPAKKRKQSASVNDDDADGNGDGRAAEMHTPRRAGTLDLSTADTPLLSQTSAASPWIAGQSRLFETTSAGAADRPRVDISRETSYFKNLCSPDTKKNVLAPPPLVDDAASSSSSNTTITAATIGFKLDAGQDTSALPTARQLFSGVGADADAPIVPKAVFTFDKTLSDMAARHNQDARPTAAPAKEAMPSPTTAAAAAPELAKEDTPAPRRVSFSLPSATTSLPLLSQNGSEPASAKPLADADGKESEKPKAAFTFTGATSTFAAPTDSSKLFGLGSTSKASDSSADQPLPANGTTSTPNAAGTTSASLPTFSTPLPKPFAFGAPPPAITNGTTKPSEVPSASGPTMNDVEMDPSGTSPATTAPAASKPAFQFGSLPLLNATGTSSAAPAASFSFGQLSTAPKESEAKPAMFNFGANSATTTTATPASSTPFTFGSLGSAAPAPPSSSTSFGATPSATSAPAPAFSFGQLSAPSGSMFGAATSTPATATSAAPSSTTFTFGSSQPTAAAAAPPAATFSFGSATTAPASTAPSFGSFGSNSTQTAGFGSTPSKPFGATFGAPAPSPAPAPASMFGSSTPANNMFTFGAGAPTTPAPSAFQFGASTPAPPGAGFGFQSPAPPAAGFGQSNNTSFSTPSAGSASGGFNFNAAPAGGMTPFQAQQQQQQQQQQQPGGGSIFGMAADAGSNNAAGGEAMPRLKKRPTVRRR